MAECNEKKIKLPIWTVIYDLHRVVILDFFVKLLEYLLLKRPRTLAKI